MTSIDNDGELTCSDREEHYALKERMCADCEFTRMILGHKESWFDRGGEGLSGMLDRIDELLITFCMGKN